MMKSYMAKGCFVSIAALLLMSFTFVGPDEKPRHKATEEIAAARAASASITGTVTFSGAIPKMRPISMGSEPTCAAKHSTPPVSEALVLGEDNKMANIFVKVKSGLADNSFETPKEPVVVNQEGCIYDPHVFGVMVDQPIKFLNSDGVLHNVHPLPKVNRSFNLAMPGTVTETTKAFSKAEEELFVIKCDVHPWMQAYMAVMPHPFYNVTGKDGKFTLSGLAAGTYEIEAWHERLGTLTKSVTVKDGETQSVDFTFER